MSLFGRYLLHPAAATTGPTGLVAADNPLGAGRVTLLRNNAQHLNEVNPRRALWTSTGVESFYRAAIGGITTAPTPTLIDWRYTRKTGGLGLYLGKHYAWRSVLHRWPRLALRCALKVASGYTAGLCLCVSPGEQSPLDARVYASATYTHTSFTEIELAMNLSDDAFARVAYSPANGVDAAAVDEQGDLHAFSVYLGGYCSSNSGSDTASVVGVTLGLEPAT
jgi:hypothetical protein